MKTRHLMTTSPTTCSIADHLATAAMKMWEDDCGIVPVLDNGEVIGVITDRDIAMALAMKGAASTEVRVGEVINGQIFSCSPDDQVAEALKAMAEHQVRRLLVLDEGKLVGLLSLNDIVLEAASTPGLQKKPTYAKIVKALRAIGQHSKFPVTVGSTEAEV